MAGNIFKAARVVHRWDRICSGVHKWAHSMECVALIAQVVNPVCIRSFPYPKFNRIEVYPKCRKIMQSVVTVMWTPADLATSHRGASWSGSCCLIIQAISTVAGAAHLHKTSFTRCSFRASRTMKVKIIWVWLKWTIQSMLRKFVRMTRLGKSSTGLF